MLLVQVAFSAAIRLIVVYRLYTYLRIMLSQSETTSNNDHFATKVQKTPNRLLLFDLQLNS